MSFAHVLGYCRVVQIDKRRGFQEVVRFLQASVTISSRRNGFAAGLAVSGTADGKVRNKVFVAGK
jgi:hypothetical protein